MSTQTFLISGVDIIDDRYHLCLLNEEGKQPRYYRGRVDTAAGQDKLLEYLGCDYQVVIIESPLALMLLAHLGAERVAIAKEGEHYGIWQRAGIERGNAMARFAASLYYDSIFEPPPLSDREFRLLLLAEEERINQAFLRVRKAQTLMEEILRGEAPSDALQQAISLMEEEPILDPLASEAYRWESDEHSFIARLVEALKK